MCLTEMIDEGLGEASGVVSINYLLLSPANTNILPYLLTVDPEILGTPVWQ